MNPEIENRLRSKFDSFPNMLTESRPNAEEIEQAAAELGVPFTDDYIEFVRKSGGAMVGDYPIFGLRPVSVMGKRRWSVVEMTKAYRQRSVPGTDGWVVFSEDHAGNPVGFDANGAVWTHDHDFGGITQLSNSLEQYVRERWLKIA